MLMKLSHPDNDPQGTEQNANSREGKGRTRLGPSFELLAADFVHFLAGRVDFPAGYFAFLAVAVGIPLLAEVG